MKAQPYVFNGARVLDIGCSDGALFRKLRSQIGAGVGIDPGLETSRDLGRYRLIAGKFPQDLPNSEPFDVITMLAILEHLPEAEMSKLADDVARFLRPGGQLIVTVPSPRADRILSALKFLRVIDGMQLDQHSGLDPRKVPSIFSHRDLMLVKVERFQVGLNNLYVFKKRTN